MKPLKQSTSVVIEFGPFIDKTDGVTLETGLVSALDHASTGILLSKNGGALTIRHATVTATTYDAHGCYRVTLDTTDTNTLGRLRVIYTDAATCLPVWDDFAILAANVYDSLVGGGDVLDVSVTQLLGTAWLTPAVAGTPDVNAKQFGGAPVTATTSVTIPAASTLATTAGAVGSVTGAVGSVTGAVGSVTGAVGSVTGNVGGNVVGSVASVTAGVTVTTNNDKTGYGLSAAAVQAIWDALTSALTTVGSIGKKLADWVIGTTQTGDSFARLGAPAGASVSADIAATKADTAAILVDTGTTLDARLPAALVGGRMDSSVGAMAANVLTASALATDAVTEIQAGLATPTNITAGTMTTVTNLTNAPTNGDLTATMKASVTAAVPTAAANADAVWDEAIAGHLGAGSTGAALNAAGSAGDPWTTPLPGAYGAGTAGKIIGDNVNATVSSRSSHSAADVWAAVTRTLTAASDSSGITTLLTRIVGTLATGTHEPQSGDAYARLGAPAGASVSADIAAIEAQTDDIGVAGAGLTALGDTRLANLDAAVSSRSTYAGGAVASVTGAVGSVTAAVTVGTNSDKTGYALTAAYDPAKTAAQAGDAMALTSGERTTLTAAIWAYVVEGTHTAVQYMRLMAAALFAKLSGAATTTVTIRDVDDTKARITATVDADDNRTAVTIDGT